MALSPPNRTVASHAHRPIKTMQYYQLMSETLGYSATEITAVDPKDATMMELSLQLVDDEPEVQSITKHAFSTKEDESYFLKWIKNSPRKIVEGGLTGIIAFRPHLPFGNTTLHKLQVGRVLQPSLDVQIMSHNEFEIERMSLVSHLGGTLRLSSIKFWRDQRS